MQGRVSGKFAVVVAAGLMVAAACAQDPAAPTSSHPIDTKPEGQTPGCSYSFTKSDNGATGSSTCVPPNDGVAPPAPALPGITAAGQQTKTTAPAAAQKFPFPGEETVPDINAPGANPDAPQPAAKAPGSQAPDSSGFKDAGSSGSPSSSSSGSSSSSSSGMPDTPDGRAPGDTSPLGEQDPAPKRSRKKLPPVVRQTPDEREAEDLQVAKFYMNDENWRAAYLRAKDAVSISDDDPEAHLALADSARKIGKLDEAMMNYKKCLALDPLPKTRKDAEKALKEMGGDEKDSLMP